LAKNSERKRGGQEGLRRIKSIEALKKTHAEMTRLDRSEKPPEFLTDFYSRGPKKKNP
jgi:hypothetical protein